MTFLKVKALNKYYPLGDKQKFHALKDIQLSFDKGELVSIIGESGSGKSTLMNVLGGLDSDFSGEILVAGENIGDYKEKELVQFHKERIGFVFQSFNLISHLSVLDNVMLAMTLSNVDKKTRVKQATQTLTQLGLENHLNKKPNQLSGGQKQRVAIARALVNNPDIIIADEPTGALDSETSEQVLAIIKEIAASGKLVILVTHSEKVAAQSSRVITIADGKIVSDKKNEGGQLDVRPDHLKESKTPNKNLTFLSAIRLALLNMKEKLSRNILIALGGSIGIMSIILMLSLGLGVNEYLTKTMNENVNPFVIEARMTEETETAAAKKIREEQAAQTQAAPNTSTKEIAPFAPDNVPFAPGNTPMGPKEIDFATENLDQLRNIPHVKEVTEGFSTFAFTGNSLVFEENEQTFMNFSTVSPNLTASNILAGAMPKTGEILLTEGIATTIFGEANQAIGQAVEVNLSVTAGALQGNFVVSGIFTPGAAIGPAALFDSVLMNWDDFEQLNQAAGFEVATNVVYLTSESEEFTPAIKAATKEFGYAGSTTDAISEVFTQMLDIFTYILTGVAGISLFVSAIMILTVLYISVVERTQEIGVIKAIGGRKKDIRRIFAAEAFLVGLFSGFIGVAIAKGLTLIGNQVVEKLFGTTILHLTWEYALAGVLVSIVISVIAGFLPANKAANLDPVEALRRD